MNPVEVIGARFRYREKVVFDAVSFALDPGSFSGIMGSNGTGKSTLLRMLLGELEPEAGSIRLMGQPARALYSTAKVGYVPQRGLAALGNFPATAGEIVLSGLYSRIGRFRFAGRQHRDLARQALKRVDMADAWSMPISQLSGGQQQRVLLARVLAGEPSILLLDEPLTGIDHATADQIYHLLRSLSRDEGLTILMVTHDISRASAYLDRIFCLEDEVLVEVERDQVEHELRHRHRHPDPHTVGLHPPNPDEPPHSIPALAPACGWPRPIPPENESEEASDGNL